MFKLKNRIRQNKSILDDSIQARAKNATLTGQVFCRAGVAFLFYSRLHSNVNTQFPSLILVVFPKNNSNIFCVRVSSCLAINTGIIEAVRSIRIIEK